MIQFQKEKTYQNIQIEITIVEPIADEEETNKPDDNTNKDEQEENLNKTANSTTNFQTLLLAKIENIDNLKDYKPFNVSKETEIIISMFESMAYEKNVKINSNIQEDIILNGHKEDIEHILSTLIDNAIKHTEPKKDILIELSKEKNEIIIQVKNMGEPIPEAEREKIFERFYRIDKSRNRNEKR